MVCHNLYFPGRLKPIQCKIYFGNANDITNWQMVTKNKASW